MKKDRALRELGLCEPEIRARGAKALFLYGSTSRGDAAAASDVDIFIDYDPDSGFNAFDLIDIKSLIERRLGAPIDLATRDGLHSKLRETIEREAIKVF
jgi:uncharacterized protein